MVCATGLLISGKSQSLAGLEDVILWDAIVLDEDQGHCHPVNDPPFQEIGPTYDATRDSPDVSC